MLVHLHWRLFFEFFLIKSQPNRVRDELLKKQYQRYSIKTWSNWHKFKAKIKNLILLESSYLKLVDGSIGKMDENSSGIVDLILS